MSRHVIPLPTPSLSGPLTPEKLGQAVRARRTQTGLRLEDAAALCGVAKHTLMKIEHGSSTSKLESILQVLKGLGISISIEPWSTEDSDDWQ